jgi:transposase InsO family protein
LFGDAIPGDRKEVWRLVFDYIEVFYNRKRLHSSPGYTTSAEKRELAFEEANVA